MSGDRGCEGETLTEVPRHVFRMDLVGGGEESVYLSCTRPILTDGEFLRDRQLSGLAESLVSLQLKLLDDIEVNGDQDFPLNISFTPLYDVKMQRYRIWQSGELTDTEKRTFLEQVQHHYHEKCDPRGYEAKYPQDCQII